jgi:hypothetical protein
MDPFPGHPLVNKTLTVEAICGIVDGQYRRVAQLDSNRQRERVDRIELQQRLGVTGAAAGQRGKPGR